VLRLVELGKGFGSTIVVDRLSLTIAHGERLVLLGGSGSGKTTSLKMVNRLIEPDSGRVELDGTDTAAMPPHELRRRIGYSFQQVGLFPHLTVAENVGITPRLLGWPADRIAVRVDELLDLVALEPRTFRDRRPAALSGGQQQRVGVARALGAAPSVLLLDEPFGALDPLTRDLLQQSLLAIARQLALTVIFVTHDVPEALVIGDRIAVMDAGRLAQVGTAAELLATPATDYVRALLTTPLRQVERLGVSLAPERTPGST
jgi:osmoprotectant transport system ATP-binding protein